VDAEEPVDRPAASEWNQKRRLLMRFPGVVTVVAVPLFAWLPFLLTTR
jgi:hypothetical protein